MPTPTSVNLNGHTYVSTQFLGYGYLQPHPDTGLTIFPDSIFTDMLATLSASPIITGGALAPSPAGAIPVADGALWRLSTTVSQFALIAGVALGTTPATAGGVVRIPNGSSNGVAARNAANSANLSIFYLDGSNVVQVGAGAASVNVPVALAANAGFAVGGTITYSSFVDSSAAAATPSALAATRSLVWASTVYGAAHMGYGTTNDVTLFNRAGTPVLGVTANTTTIALAGALGIAGVFSATAQASHVFGATTATASNTVVYSKGSSSSGQGSSFGLNRGGSDSYLGYESAILGTANAHVLMYTPAAAAFKIYTAATLAATFGTDQSFALASTTDATTTTTGSFQSAGGGSFVKSFYVGGSIYLGTNNSSYLYGTNASGSHGRIIGLNGSNVILIAPDNDPVTFGTAAVTFASAVSGITTLATSSDITTSGTGSRSHNITTSDSDAVFFGTGSTAAHVILRHSSATAGRQTLDIISNSGNIRFRLLNDAGSSLVTDNLFKVDYLGAVTFMNAVAGITTLDTSGQITTTYGNGVSANGHRVTSGTTYTGYAFEHYSASTDGAAFQHFVGYLNGGVVYAVRGNGQVYVVNDASGMGGMVSLEDTDSSVGTDTMVQFKRNGSNCGSITTTLALVTAYNTTSDARLKDLRALGDVGHIIDSIVVFDAAFKGDVDRLRYPMFTAQQLYEHAPWAVIVGGENPEKDPWMTDASKLIPLHHAELQRLRARVRELETVVRAA